MFRRRLCSNRYYWITRSKCASPGADSTQNKRKESLHRETTVLRWRWMCNGVCWRGGGEGGGGEQGVKLIPIPQRRACFGFW